MPVGTLEKDEAPLFGALFFRAPFIRCPLVRAPLFGAFFLFSRPPYLVPLEATKLYTRGEREIQRHN